MGREAILRQMALASYGTRFLRGEIALDAFARHGLFEGIGSQFLEGGQPHLSTDDYIEWLTMQREAGAQRISLQLLASLAMPPQQRSYAHERCLVVHFPSHYQLWRTQCVDHVLDRYWSVQIVAGLLEVPLTDWTALMAAIRKDLDVPANCPPHTPYFAPWWEQSAALKLPVFPYTSAFYLPHQLMNMLDKQDAQASNDINGKNENSYYYHLSEAEAAKVDYWAARLSCWILEVQLRCANEYRTADISAAEAPLVRLVEPPPPPVHRAPKAPAARSTTGPITQAARPAPSRASRWATLLGLFSKPTDKDERT